MYTHIFLNMLQINFRDHFNEEQRRVITSVIRDCSVIDVSEKKLDSIKLGDEVNISHKVINELFISIESRRSNVDSSDTVGGHAGDMKHYFERNSEKNYEYILHELSKITGK